MPFVIALIVIIIGGVAFYFLKDETSLVNQPTRPSSSEELIPLPPSEIAKSAPPEGGASTFAYTDGTYKTRVKYLTPKRDEYALDVSLTVTNDIVTNAAIVYSQGAEVDPNAQRFEAAYQNEILGKSLDSISLSRVGGASLTTGAFNEALANIKTDAKS